MHSQKRVYTVNSEMSNESHTRYVVSLSLEEAASGCNKIIRMKASELCPSCNGSGASPLPDSAICQECTGAGQVYKLYPISVQIPAGVEDGCRLRVRSGAEGGLKGKPPKELEVVVSIRGHRLFKRLADDIVYEMPLNFAQAALGCEVMVPTLKRPVKLGIPPGTQTGKVLRLKGKGIPHFGRRGKGDQLVEVRVVTPVSVDEHQQRLLEELARSFSQTELGKARRRDGRSGDG